MTLEERVEPGDEAEPHSGDFEIKTSTRRNLVPIRPQPWGVVAGMGVALLAVVLGGVLGYLVRPVLDPIMPAEALSSVAEALTDPTPTLSPSAATLEAGTSPNESRSELTPTPTIMDFLLADARHIAGDPDAPVTMIEFSDFKCPYCGRFSTETLPQIRQTYIDTGKVRFVYKHFAILGAESNRAAEASECAAEQDRFWEYHDQIFADQTTNHRVLDDDRLISLADEVGLDVATFRECLAAGRYTEQIKQASQTVQSLGVRGTPGFVINGVYVTGAQPFEAFQEVIEAQLKRLDPK